MVVKLQSPKSLYSTRERNSYNVIIKLNIISKNWVDYSLNEVGTQRPTLVVSIFYSYCLNL